MNDTESSDSNAEKISKDNITSLDHQNHVEVTENADGHRVLRVRQTIRMPICYLDELKRPRIMMLREVPRNYDEAVKSSDVENWKAAMYEEMDSRQMVSTWKLADLPAGRKAIGNRWVFAIKLDNNNDIVQYKARLVAEGFSQRPGLDFSETFSPVVWDLSCVLLFKEIGTSDYLILKQHS
ncbi:uncharacterized protein LOC126273431 [Schistocerca gregaria]|uniref:uncharacterized protein LOC126273431 n=1 Tax=Schistocerca gregaria TaxID=7010 RepID=UPI00211E2022|nr:uncharacterized protein LOC126273431 [Schistocerca gregaria]